MIKLASILITILCVIISDISSILVKDPFETHNEALTHLQDEIDSIHKIAVIDSARLQVVSLVFKVTENLPKCTLSIVEKDYLANVIYEMTVKYQNLSPQLICAVITHETGKTWSSRCVSYMGAVGLMQIMPTTGVVLAIRSGYTYTDSLLYDPRINIELGCSYLTELIAAYGVDGGLAAYNGGPRVGKLWAVNKTTIKQQTIDYVPSVLKLNRNYGIL